MKKIISSVLGVSLLISGCATTSKIDPNYKAYLDAQQANSAVHKQEIQLVRIKAKEGQTITLGGVDEFTVSMPAPASAPVQQQVQQPSQWAGVVGQGLSVVGTVLGIKYAGQAAVNLSNSVGSAANHGYEFVQAPAANVTTTSTISGSGVIGSGTYNASPVTTNTISGSGVLGSGTYNANPTITTTTTTSSNNPVTNTGAVVP